MTRSRRGRRGGLATAAFAMALAGCAGDEGRATEAAPIITLAADSASNPTVAFDAASGRAYLAWVGIDAGKNAVFVTSLERDGRAMDAVRANDIPGDAAPHLQAPAQVAVGPEGTVYVLWQNNTPVEGRRFPASDLRLAVSTDGGQSFLPAVTVNDDAGGPPSSHTFHDLAVAADGTLYVSWIDSRSGDAVAHQRLPAAPSAPAADAHAHHPAATGMGGATFPASHDHGGEAGPSGPEIRVARSTDGGRSFEPSVVVDSAACPCCRTSLVLAADGTVYVAWRKIFPGEVRDVVVAGAERGALRFSEPVRVHQDGWVFPGCPHAGPSLALDEEERLLVGWYTGQPERQGLWYAVSDDGGRSFGAPWPVLTADWVPPSQLRLAASGGRVWAAWDDRTGDRPLLRAATATFGETLRPIESWTASGGDPSIAAAPEGALVAWLDGAAARARWLHPSPFFSRRSDGRLSPPAPTDR